MATMTQMSEEVRQCIKDCTDCASVCTETVTYCLQQGGAHAEASHIRLLLDCAEICKTCADCMLRGSEFCGHIAALCADICEQCARSCQGFTDDPQMQSCAEVCRHCATSCRAIGGEMAQAA